MKRASFSKISSSAAKSTFSTITVTGKIAKEILEESEKKPTEETIKKNRKALELLNKLRMS